MVAAQLSEAGPLVQPARRAVVGLDLEVHMGGALVGGPAGERGQYLPGGAPAAGGREGGHAEHAGPAGIGHRAADRDHPGRGRHRGVGAGPVHPAQQVPLRAGVAAGTVHRRPGVEPGIGRPVIDAHPRYLRGKDLGGRRRPQ